MKRKVYNAPSIHIKNLCTVRLLSASGTGATIPDSPWANARKMREDDYEWDEEEE